MRDMGPILAKIERLEKDCAYWNNEHSKETERADKLKVITELAVKRLIKLSTGSGEAVTRAYCKDALSEIERLQNG